MMFSVPSIFSDNLESIPALKSIGYKVIQSSSRIELTSYSQQSFFQYTFHFLKNFAEGVPRVPRCPTITPSIPPFLLLL